MGDIEQRMAAVTAAADFIEEGMVLGLGSGRAVFALAERVGARPDASSLSVVVASPMTAERARAAGLQVIDLEATDRVDLALDGADEIDPHLAMIKGGGAALLREKLLAHAAERTVIFCQARKRVERLGSTWRLPVQVVPYGWTWTRRRLLDLVPEADLRRDEAGTPVTTAEGDYLIDVLIPEGDLRELADALKSTLGVVEHGLFLDEADVVLLGNDDGTVTRFER